MIRRGWICLVVLGVMAAPASAQQALPQALQLPGPLKFCTKKEIQRLNKKLRGQVLDFTSNHEADRRIYSPALDLKRDLYVYLPPGYDAQLRYPAMMYLHGILQDEKAFLEIVSYFDDAIAEGKLPPTIIAAPDGSLRGRPTFLNAGSFYLNSNSGRFEDYIAHDVWEFVQQNFAIRPEREAHILAGASMGGFGAFNVGIKHRDQFGILIGIMPALNLRYIDCHGRYFVPFDPNCTAYGERYRPHQPVGKFLGGILCVRQMRFVDPLFGRSQAVTGHMARESPIEMLDAYDVKPGEFSMFVGYGTRDQFNIGAHCESFAHHAAERNLKVTMKVVPGGDHGTETGLAMFDDLVDWLRPQLAPFAPAAPLYGPRVRNRGLLGLGLFQSKR